MRDRLVLAVQGGQVVASEEVAAAAEEVVCFVGQQELEM